MAAREIRVEIVADSSELRRLLEIAELNCLKLEARMTIARINSRLDRLEQEPLAADELERRIVGET